MKDLAKRGRACARASPEAGGEGSMDGTSAEDEAERVELPELKAAVGGEREMGRFGPREDEGVVLGLRKGRDGRPGEVHRGREGRGRWWWW